MTSAPAPASEPSSKRGPARGGEAAPSTIKAIAQSGHASPEWRALREVTMPVGDAQVLVRVHVSSQKIDNVVLALDGGRAR